MMTEAMQQYFDLMESLSQHPAWKLFRDDLIGFQEAIASQWASLAPENLRFEQGRYAGIKQAADHFETLESLKAQALADDAEEASLNV